MNTPIDESFAHYLAEGGYEYPRVINDGFYAAIKRFAFTHAIIVGEIGDRNCYLDRWCYRSPMVARAALEAWDGTGEPSGWHRHPSTGRRISEHPDTIDDHGRRVPVGEMYHYA